ncbi:hypothetical protein LCGC14_2258150 [marine sediment metagenome]|uniref:Uncharacterized protein n=1 Tax=marine sediment metagenome TaxID=412755 RepID=A0A0F9D0U0_9ZZZZ
MGLITITQCNVCKSTYKVIRFSVVVFEHTRQEMLDFVPVETVEELLDQGALTFLCPKHLKRAKKFMDRAFSAPTRRKAGQVAAPEPKG